MEFSRSVLTVCSQVSNRFSQCQVSRTDPRKAFVAESVYSSEIKHLSHSTASRPPLLQANHQQCITLSIFFSLRSLPSLPLSPFFPSLPRPLPFPLSAPSPLSHSSYSLLDRFNYSILPMNSSSESKGHSISSHLVKS